MGPILNIDHLSRSFGEIKAVDDISLKLKRGEIFGFLGPNGAGKTTTIGMILGLINPDHGRIIVFGKNTSPKTPEPLRNVGALFGAVPAFYPYFSVFENIDLVAQLHDEVDKVRVFEVIEMVGLSDAQARKAKNLSTGMKQRLGLGMALVHQPDLLILDEPTNGMDPNGTRFVRKLLKTLSSQGVTIFLSSHRLHEVEQICDRVAVLNKGKIIKQGSVEDLLTQSGFFELKVSDISRARESLLRMPEVQLHLCDAGKVIRVAGYGKEQIVKHLVEDGVIPDEIKKVNQNLEDLFSTITEREVA